MIIDPVLFKNPESDLKKSWRIFVKLWVILSILIVSSLVAIKSATLVKIFDPFKKSIKESINTGIFAEITPTALVNSGIRTVRTKVTVAKNMIQDRIRDKDLLNLSCLSSFINFVKISS